MGGSRCVCFWGRKYRRRSSLRGRCRRRLWRRWGGYMRRMIGRLIEICDLWSIAWWSCCCIVGFDHEILVGIEMHGSKRQKAALCGPCWHCRGLDDLLRNSGEGTHPLGKSCRSGGQSSFPARFRTRLSDSGVARSPGFPSTNATSSSSSFTGCQIEPSSHLYACGHQKPGRLGTRTSKDLLRAVSCPKIMRPTILITSMCPQPMTSTFSLRVSILLFRRDQGWLRGWNR